MEINWERLKDIAEKLSQPSRGGGSAYEEDLQMIVQTLETLKAQEDYAGIVELRGLLTPVVARDSISIHKSLQRLSDEAIYAANKIGNFKEQAHLLGANGHNLHRQGLHKKALADFALSRQLYELVGEPLEMLKNDSMMAQCHRALGNVGEAKLILETIISKVDRFEAWFGNPLQVLGWIERDSLRLEAAEKFFREALVLHRKADDPDILSSGTLADLGEVIGLQRRHDEALNCFEESLMLIRKYEGQYDRQEARTTTKMAELLIRERKYSEALKLLDHADDLVAYGAYKDQLWKIELLRAMIKFRMGDIGGALRRMRSAKTIYEELGLPPKGFIQHTVARLKLGSGLLSFRRK